MNKHKILSDIDAQISELGSFKTLFLGTITDRFEGFVTLDKIDSKITSVKRFYYFSSGLSITIGGLLYVAAFSQILGSSFGNLSKSGLLIILGIGSIAMTIRNKIDLERLKMIKHLLGLKLMIDHE